MLISIECRDAGEMLEKIMSHALHGDLGSVIWESNTLVISDEAGPIRFVAHVERTPEMLRGLSNEFVRLESFTPVAMPNRARALLRKRAIAERFKRC